MGSSLCHQGSYSQGLWKHDSLPSLLHIEMEAASCSRHSPGASASAPMGSFNPDP